jgi:stage II sporulation protein D
LLAGTQAPTVRVLLGRPRATERLAVRGQAWRLEGGPLRQEGRQDVGVTLGVAGGQVTLDGRPTGASLLRLTVTRSFELGGRGYPGTLLIRAADKDLLELVDELDLETYVAGVIGHEVGPGARPSTYRAQAICARTYAYGKLSAPEARDKPWHVFDDTRSQVYGGLEVPSEFGITYDQMLQATVANRGVILSYQGRPIQAYYSSTCGGHTTDAATSHLDAGTSAEVLRGVPCPWCRPTEAYGSKYFTWNETVSSARIIKGLESWGGITAPIHQIEVVQRGRGDWAAVVEITYGPSRRTKRVPGIHFRSIAGLRSHNIQSITPVAGGAFTFAGRGWGHGVGMCQVGAIQMGLRGATESDILRFYFPGADLTHVY